MTMLWLAGFGIVAFLIWYWVVNPLIGLIQWWKDWSNEKDDFFE